LHKAKNDWGIGHTVLGRISIKRACKMGIFGALRAVLRYSNEYSNAGRFRRTALNRSEQYVLVKGLR